MSTTGTAWWPARNRATTPDPFDGIRAALGAVLAEVDTGLVHHAMLGTTHPANAIIERKDLGTVGVLRLGRPLVLRGPAGAAWPHDLMKCVLGHTAIIGGGFEYNGEEIAPLDVDAVRRFADEVGGSVSAIAVTSAFAAANNAHELRAAEILQERLGPQVPVSLSHQVGALGLLERENATILNASLFGVARNVVEGFTRHCASMASRSRRT